MTPSTLDLAATLLRRASTAWSTIPQAFRRSAGAVLSGLLALAAASLSAVGLAAQPKVLLVGFDGLRPDALLAASAPHLDRLREEGAWSLSAQTGDVPISGPGWSSAFTGVWREKHGVADNSFAGSRFDLYPVMFCRLESARPAARSASIVRWGPLGTSLVSCADPSTAPASDDLAAAEAVALLEAEEAPDLIFLHLNAPDSAGHVHGFSPTSAGYLQAIADSDTRLGRVLEALAGRAGREEDWLVIATTDHGGQGTDHHDNIPENRTIFVFLHGAAAAPGELLPAPGIVDVAATVLAFLQVDIDPAWGLDGRPVGLRPATPAAFRLPGDSNGDGRRDLADAVRFLEGLFGAATLDPCGSGQAAASLSLLDLNADGVLDLSDPVALLLHLFAASPPGFPAQCREVRDCGTACEGA